MPDPHSCFLRFSARFLGSPSCFLRFLRSPFVIGRTSFRVSFAFRHISLDPLRVSFVFVTFPWIPFVFPSFPSFSFCYRSDSLRVSFAFRHFSFDPLRVSFVIGRIPFVFPSLFVTTYYLLLLLQSLHETSGGR